MNRFQPGEEVTIRLVFESGVPIKSILVLFVHEENENEHVMIDFNMPNEDEPIAPALQTTLDFGKVIPRGVKPGIYRLDTIKFETFSGEDPVDYRGELELPRFEVIPEREWAPIVQVVAVLTDSQWRRLKRREQE